MAPIISQLAEQATKLSTEAQEIGASNAQWLGDLQSRLSEWFGTPFALFDALTGDRLLGSARPLSRDEVLLGEMCRAVASGGKAEFVEENGLLLSLAIPLPGLHSQRVVGVGTFVISRSATRNQLSQLATLMNVPLDVARLWFEDQQVWQPQLLLNMGQLAGERLAAEWRLRALDREVSDLTLNLSTTYEEISLIYRLTQNLKLTSSSEELAALAIEWLAEVVPAECLAVQLLPNNSSDAESQRSKPVLLTYGTTPLQVDEVTELLEEFDARPGKRPLVINEIQTSQSSWPWPEVRQLIAVSLCEGANCFGWLLAVNHAQGAEFGTVEASLLSSVAAILGIHGGNADLYQQQHELFKGMVRALTSAIDAKDPYTCGHSERVARVAVCLAEEMGCDAQQVDTIYLSGLLHDIGKIGIDDTVLRKPGKLTDAEYEHIKMHAEIGHRILCDIKQLDHVLPVVLHHHEQWNGQGYPSKLAGEGIPLLARIVAVADSFDAMSSDRPYRPGLPDEKLDAIFRSGAGQQWDAQVVAAFFRVREEMRAISNRNTTAPSSDCREHV